jgi:hypothetical protein
MDSEIKEQVVESEQYKWQSCCFDIDKRCVTFIVQTFIGVGLLVFCAVSIQVQTNCDKATPFWGLIGTLCGFFFRKISFSGRISKEDSSVRPVYARPLQRV